MKTGREPMSPSDARKFPGFFLRFVPLLFCLFLPFSPIPAMARATGDDVLLNTLRKDVEGIYLSHIPQAFSLSVIAVRPGILYAGTISDPGGSVRILSKQAPRKEIVLERIAKDKIRFTLAPVQTRSPDTFSFQTRTGCFTLTVWQSPPRKLPLIHLNGYTPPVKKMPVIFCGHGHHVRYEWQGPYPGK